jgi:hypothetical protein
MQRPSCSADYALLTPRARASFGPHPDGFMDFELRATTTGDTGDEPPRTPSEFAISAAPLVANAPAPELSQVPPAHGAPLLCLMARDPQTLFAYWDVDWPAAFRGGQPADRKVHLRVLNADRAEQHLEVEPMAGSCYVKVDAADAAYSAEIGFYQPPSSWNSIASSDLISTPPDRVIGDADSEYATVPFHLSFQHMIDMLRSSRSDNAPLVTQLAEFRDSTRSDDTAPLTPQERELAGTLDRAEAASPQQSVPEPSRVADVWNRGRFERILGFGATSPSSGFGGS